MVVTVKGVDAHRLDDVLAAHPDFQEIKPNPPFARRIDYNMKGGMITVHVGVPGEHCLLIEAELQSRIITVLEFLRVRSKG